MLDTAIFKGGREVIDALAADWLELCGEGPGNEPFLRPEWFRAFVESFGSEVEIITVRRDGRLRALLPLVRERSSIHRLRVRKLQGLFNLNSPRFDLVHGADESERDEIVGALWRQIEQIGRWDALEFRLVKNDSWLSDLLVRAAGSKHPTGVWPMDGAPYISIPPNAADDGWIDSYFAGSRKHLGKELTRRLKRLRELGEVEFVVIRNYSADLIPRYLELESRGWKGRGGTAALLDQRVAQLHDSFARVTAANGALYACELRLDGKTIAMSINIRYDQQTVHWKTTYDEEYARYSPGNLLFKELLTDCVNSGSSEIDFLSPSTTNKSFWATGERDHAAFYVFQASLFGRLAGYWKFTVIQRFRQLKFIPRTPIGVLNLLIAAAQSVHHD